PDTADFRTLADASGLDPETDFQHLDLSSVDLKNCDLSHINFRGTNFDGALIDGATFNRSANLKGAVGSAIVAETGPPDDETRARWEREAAVAVLTGQPIPPARRPHIQSLALSAWDRKFFETLKAAQLPLGNLYENPNGEAYKRRLKLDDIAPLAGLSALQELYLSSTQVADLAPLAGLSALKVLGLNDTQVADLAPLAGLSALQALDLRGTQVADLAPLAGLSALQELYLSSTQVTDWSPVAHVEDVVGRPEDWKARKP
ncbi:MAG: leucine-rich repeat domain-containing protein, partial [Pseudomonadota bacterium]